MTKFKELLKDNNCDFGVFFLFNTEQNNMIVLSSDMSEDGRHIAELIGAGLLKDIKDGTIDMKKYLKDIR